MRLRWYSFPDVGSFVLKTFAKAINPRAGGSSYLPHILKHLDEALLVLGLRAAE